jgi:hypothetical protein
LPGAFVVVGDTVDEAKKKKALLDSLVHPDSGLASLSIALGCDASDFDLDGPLPRESGPAEAREPVLQFVKGAIRCRAQAHENG